MKSIPSRQSGATLLISLIMLVLMTLLAVTTFRLGKANLQIAANMQQRNQAFAAAQGAIEQVISSTQFMTTPANAIPHPCNLVVNTTCVDVNGDGVMDVTVAVAPSCVSTQVIPVAALSLAKPNDVGCLVGVSQQFGVVGAAHTGSLCANMLWDVQAVATDPLSNAQFAINQGIAVRVAATTVCN
ncbi:MAG: PilX N-terminal domain-containing pilus assembly protein [Betaproteobacteria bacterium]|nr:PilX N-terminal domain-containing pilus assembly protein [Betaproteobacteria bacterium]